MNNQFQVFKVESKSALMEFIRFPFRLYTDCQYYVPPIIDFELSSLDRDKNPAFEVCDASYWLIKRKGKAVGRIAAILLNQELLETKRARFGWVDFIDDKEVSKLLFNLVEEWALKKGAKYLHGPMGFTDLDFEGALIEGFEEPATQATIYNYPYYISHYESLGFTKSVDWIEIRGNISKVIPEKLAKISEYSMKRFNLRVLKFKRDKHIQRYAFEVIALLNKTYKGLYGYYNLTDNQIAYYVKLYFDFIKKELVNIIVNKEGRIIAMAITMPSMTKAFQKANGHIFPFGFIPILKSFYFKKELDLFLIAVDPDYQKFGTSAVIFHELFTSYIKNGYKKISTGPMLEENQAVLNLWNDYLNLSHTTLRRRCFIKQI